MRDNVFKAIDAADVDILTGLLEQNSSLASARSNDGMSTVLFSLYINKPEITELLLNYQPELDLYDLSALGRAGQISALLATSPKSVHEYSGDGFVALHVASYFGHANVVKLLLDNGADVDKIAMNGSELTALQSAVACMHTDVVRVLLDYNPDVNVRMLGGFTPLMSAAAMGAKEIISLLLEKGADKKLISDDGRTASEFALATEKEVLA
jgi:ankyrin repeat protein